MVSPSTYQRFGPAISSPAAIAVLGTPNAAVSSTAPVVTIGLTWSSTGSNAFTPALPIMMQFLVDITNARGGVWINTVQHAVAVVIADDQSSVDYMLLLYHDMLSQGVQVFFTPYGDDYLKALLPVIQLANASFVAVQASNADPFLNNTGGNLWSYVPTADLFLRNALNRVNNATQHYAKQIAQGEAQDASYYMGVLHWVNKENTARQAAGVTDAVDLVHMVVDQTWPDKQDAATYAPYYDMCPDDTDLVICLADGLGSVAGMAASRLHPKAAIGMTGDDDFDDGNSASVTIAAGFLDPYPITLVPFVTLRGGDPFVNLFDAVGLYEQYTAITFGAPYPIIHINFGYANDWGNYLAALNSSASITPSAVRLGMLSMNGQLGQLGAINFNASTGVNVALIGSVSQCLQDGAAVDTQDGMLFPFPFSYPRRVYAGDEIISSQTNFYVILGLIIAVLGSWVAQILVEQSIFVRRRGGSYQLWLLVVTLSLAGVGVWCADLMQSVALSTTIPGDAAPQTISWSLPVALLALLPSLLLTWAGLLCLIQDVECINDSRTSVTTKEKQSLREEKEANKKKAALSNSQHFWHLAAFLSYRIALGSVLVIAALILTRFTLWYAWQQAAGFRSNGWAWVVTLLLDCVCVPVALLIYFHGLRWRTLAVFLFAGTVMADWQLHAVSLSFFFQPSLLESRALSSPALSTTASLLISGLIAAFISFVFIGLQFSRMQLSRNGLSVLVASMEASIHKLQQRVSSAERIVGRQRKGADVLARIIDAIHLTTALPQEYALPLALHSGTYELGAQSALGRKQGSPSLTAGDGNVGVNRNPSVRGSSHRTSQSGTALWRGFSVSIHPRESDTPADDREVSTTVLNRKPVVNRSHRNYENAVQVALEAQEKTAQQGAGDIITMLARSNTKLNSDADEHTFLGTAPLMGETTTSNSLSQPSLESILEHPIAVEVFKRELDKSSSVESLIFYLHVRRYRTLISARVRKLLATAIANAFVQENAPQQINIETRQRDVIMAAVRSKSDSGCTPELFNVAERECVMLMRTNAFKPFVRTSGYRLCMWLCHHVDVQAVFSLFAATEEEILNRGSISALSSNQGTHAALPNGLDKGSNLSAPEASTSKQMSSANE